MKRCEQIFCLLFIFLFFVNRSSAEQLVLSIDFKNPLTVTDEKFLSLTVDPVTLLYSGNALSTDFEKSVNLAKALHPAYLRIAGPHHTFYEFSDENSPRSQRNGNRILNEADWVLAHQWAEKSGLDVISCISPQYLRDDSKNSESAMEIISFSDHMGYNTSWQLGYECQNNCNVSASELAKRVVNLRTILNEIPRYSRSMITGPDVIFYGAENQRQYLQEYFKIAAPALSAITWHPNFASITIDNEGVLIRHDTLGRDKEKLIDVIGHYTKEKPLWIAESKEEECRDLFLGAIIFTRRLGNAAKSNIKVVMRQPTDLTEPTPAYWTSVLHKNLVGRKVLEAKLQRDGKKHVYFYSQCTKTSNIYDKGSITIFGVNLSPESVDIDLKEAKITTAHEYVLSPGLDAANRMFSQSILLNNEPLDLVNNTVPDLKPLILKDPRGLHLNLQSGGIGFWVLPDLKIKSCMDNGEEIPSPTRTRRTNIRVPRDVDEQLGQFKKSVEDREAARMERRKQRKEYRAAGRQDVKKEFNRLTKFVKGILDDYEGRIYSKSRDSSRSENNDRRNKNRKEQSDSQEDRRTKLQQFKRRLSLMRNATRNSTTRTMFRDAVSEAIQNIISLISKVDDALEASKREKSVEGRANILAAVKDYYKSLYNQLTSVNLESLYDSGSTEATVNQETNRSKRDVLGWIPDGQNPKESSILRGNVKVRRKIGREEVQPRVFELGSSEENTFYGFFKTEPVEGFPEGDVYFATGDSLQHEAVDQESERNREKNEDVWTEDGTNYRDHEPNQGLETVQTPKRVNARAPAELWEAETYERQKKGRSNDGRLDSRFEDKRSFNDYKNNLRSLTGYFKPSRSPNDHQNDYGGSKLDRSLIRPVNTRQAPSARVDLEHRLLPKLENAKSQLMDRSSMFKNAEPSNNDRLRGTQRFKRRSTDLNLIFNQEMINEDDANSRDCKCRVRRSKHCKCRSKRDTSKFVDSSIDMEVVPQEEIPVDLSEGTIHPNLQEFPLVNASPEHVEREEQQTEASNTIVQVESNLKSQEIQAQTARNEPPLENQSNAQESFGDSNAMVLNSLSAASPMEEDRKSLTKTSIHRSEDTFFRATSGKSEEEITTIDTVHSTTEHTAFVWQNSTSNADETVAKEFVENDSTEAKETEITRAETSGSTTALLPPERIIEESEYDYDNNRIATGSSKRQVEEVSSAKFDDDEEKRENAEVKEGVRQKKKKLKDNRKAKENNEKSFEARLMKRIKSWLTSRNKMGKTGGEEVVKTALGRKSDRNARDYRRSREEQIKKLREKLHEKREKMLRRYEKDVLDVMEEMNDEEKRNLRRREALEAIKYGDDFRDTIDREKLAYILMYAPIKRDVKREESTYEESDEDVTVPATEIVRARNVRERIFNPKTRQSFSDSRILEHPNPYELWNKIIKLGNFYENEASNGKPYKDDSKEDKSYFALVENLKHPKIFQKFDVNRKRSVDAFQPHRRAIAIVESLGEGDSDEDSDELFGSREIYIIDPSKYRGGEPTLQLYGSPSRSEEIDEEFVPGNVYEMILESTSYNPYKTDRTEQYKREDQPPRQSSEESNEDITKFENLSRNLNSGELLRILINALDVQSAEQLLKNLAGQNAIEKRNLMHATIEETSGEESEENASDEKGINEHKESSEGEDNVEGKSLEGSDTKGIVDTFMEQQEKPTNDTSSEAPTPQESIDESSEEINVSKIRKRRDLPSDFKRKTAREIVKCGRNNYLCLRENSEGSPGENPTEVFEIVKESNYYKTVPVKAIESSSHADLRKPLLIRRGRTKNDDSKKNENSPEQVKITMPLKLSKEYSSVETGGIPIVAANNPQTKLLANYQDKSDSSEVRSEEQFEDAESDALTRSDQSSGNVNLKDLLSERRGVFIGLPWTKVLGRTLREAINREKAKESASIEKVQPVELQRLEGFSSPTTTGVDDVEKSISLKKPLEKYTKKEDSINGGRYAERWNNENRGLPSLIEGNIPKLENVVVDGLEKAQNLTESVEQLIENLDENFNKTLTANNERNSVNPESIGSAQNVFHNAITSVRKFFMLLSGITRIFRGRELRH